MDFDRSVLSFGELLEIFWDSHEPTRQSWARQYLHAIFYHSEEQKRMAEASRNRIAQGLTIGIKTAVLPFTGFTLAEDYHQKHALQRFLELWEEFRSIYPEMTKLIASTAAARVNGYLAGFGSCDILKDEIESLGLSVRGRKTLLEIVCGRSLAMRCCGAK
jgi:hypothetical protein